MADDRDAEHDEDPRAGGVSDQRPEEHPAGDRDGDAEQGSEPSETGADRAPSSASPADGPPSQATGNPHAAGG